MSLKIEMKQKHDSRIAIRLPSEERQQIEKLIQRGKLKSISQVVRTALEKFLKESECV